MSAERRVLFFGCDGRPGHGWFGPGLSSVSWRHEVRGVCPWDSGGIDAMLAPRTEPRQPGDRRVRGEELTQGVAALHHRDGWTALSFWDRTGDSRPNSNSTFVVEGILAFDEVVAVAREHFPQLFARFTFEIAPAPSGAREDGDDDA